MFANSVLLTTISSQFLHWFPNFENGKEEPSVCINGVPSCDLVSTTCHKLSKTVHRFIPYLQNVCCISHPSVSLHDKEFDFLDRPSLNFKIYLWMLNQCSLICTHRPPFCLHADIHFLSLKLFSCMHLVPSFLRFHLSCTKTVNR